MSIKLWIDTDLGLDDAIAIIIASHSGADILGISVVQGNVNLRQCSINALNILNLTGKIDVDVFIGQEAPLLRPKLVATEFHGKNGIGEVELPMSTRQPIIQDSLYRIYEKIINCSEKVKFVAIGPLTNVALLIKTFPDIQDKISDIIVMGGSQLSGNVTPVAEFNFYNDPEAAKIVIDQAINCTIFPVEATYQPITPKKLLEEYKISKYPFLAKVSELFEYLYNKCLEFGETPNIHDACCVIYALKPEIFETAQAKVEIELGSTYCDGKSIIDFKQRLNKTKLTNIVTKIDTEQYWSYFEELIQQANTNSTYNTQNNFINSETGVSTTSTNGFTTSEQSQLIDEKEQNLIK